jgi:hypothetical protein
MPHGDNTNTACACTSLLENTGKLGNQTKVAWACDATVNTLLLLAGWKLQICAKTLTLAAQVL